MSCAASKVAAWVFGQEKDHPALPLFLPLPFLPFLPSFLLSFLGWWQPASSATGQTRTLWLRGAFKPEIVTVPYYA